MPVTVQDLSADAVEQLAVRLPAGYNIAELRFVPTEARVVPEEALTDSERAVLAQTHVAAPPMINHDGRPTILRIVKWMCHAGSPNENGDMFMGEELRAIAHDLFAAPNFGVMDWNHEAIVQNGDGAPPLMGVWYKADYAMNPATNQWGILVTGMLFAWLFPQVADELLAEQARNGTIKGSMACIPKSVEYVDAGGRSARVLHNPVFFTHSLLSRRPADAGAVGLVTEDPSVSPETLKQEMMMDPPSERRRRQNTPPAAAATLESVLAVASQPGGTMTDEEIQALEKANSDLTALMAELVVQMETLAASRATEGTENSTKMETYETQVAELMTARDALATTLQETEATLEVVRGELATALAELGVLQEREAAQASAERLAARLLELHENYRAAHERRDPAIQQKLEALWLALSDEDWELKKIELSAGLPVKVGYVVRSQTEGALPVGESDDLKAKIESHIK